MDKRKGSRDGAKDGRDKPGPMQGAVDRRERLAEQLRANLLKRKQQARARRAGESPAEPESETTPETEGA